MSYAGRSYSLKHRTQNSSADTKASLDPYRGLHDFWFAGSSSVMDRFASWGSRVPELRARFGLQSDEVPAAWLQRGRSRLARIFLLEILCS